MEHQKQELLIFPEHHTYLFSCVLLERNTLQKATYTKKTSTQNRKEPRNTEEITTTAFHSSPTCSIDLKTFQSEMQNAVRIQSFTFVRKGEEEEPLKRNRFLTGHSVPLNYNRRDFLYEKRRGTHYSFRSPFFGGK